jgi:hypothetical protein
MAGLEAGGIPPVHAAALGEECSLGELLRGVAVGVGIDPVAVAVGRRGLGEEVDDHGIADDGEADEAAQVAEAAALVAVHLALVGVRDGDVVSGGEFELGELDDHVAGAGVPDLIGPDELRGVACGAGIGVWGFEPGLGPLSHLE